MARVLIGFVVLHVYFTDSFVQYEAKQKHKYSTAAALMLLQTYFLNYSSTGTHQTLKCLP
jgi:hypothetical protein